MGAGTSAVVPQFDASPYQARLDLVLRNRNLARYGRRVVEERVYEFPGFAPAHADLLADWKADPLAHRSWRWNTASFNFMPWLLAHYGSTESRYPALALELLDSWRTASPDMADYEFAVHDHAVALRAENAMLLLAYLLRFGLARERWADLCDWIDELAGMLQQPSFYSRHTNHGIEQARILAVCAYMLHDRPESQARWETAIARLADELEFAFTGEGVHVENSPTYHVFVSGIFLKVLEMLPRTRLGTLGDAIDGIMPKAMNYLTHVMRPDGKLPPIGDTEIKAVTSRFPGFEQHPEWPLYVYSASAGRRGRKPQETIGRFPRSGYLSYRDRWDRHAMHVLMKSGYLSRYHRHDDDLNLIVYWGEDWLVDGGGYSYVETDEVRRYLRSKWAHNVPVIDDQRDRWPRLGRHRHKAGLEIEAGDDGSVRAEGFTGGYPGCRATRELRIQAGRRQFSVCDRIQPDTGETRLYRSLWHVPNDKDIYRRNQTVLIVSKATGRGLRIRNLGERFGSVGKFVPRLGGKAGAVVSPRANHLEKAQIVSFNRRGAAFECRLRFEFLLRADASGWKPL